MIVSLAANIAAQVKGENMAVGASIAGAASSIAVAAEDMIDFGPKPMDKKDVVEREKVLGKKIVPEQTREKP